MDVLQIGGEYFCCIGINSLYETTVKDRFYLQSLFESTYTLGVEQCITPNMIEDMKHKSDVAMLI